MIRNGLAPRQIWYTPTRPPVSTTTKANVTSQPQSALCTIALPSGGVIYFNNTHSTTLTDAITFESVCENTGGVHGCPNSGNSTVVKSNDPFYASVAPQIYALSTATIVSYMLVILVFITPRTFYVGGPSGGSSFLGLRNLVPRGGNSNVMGVGRRPLLQKIAAITVAISLTIATADTFEVANSQYDDGLMDAQSLVEDVIGSTEIRVVRVVSDTFLWLAQVQTLIRLFPRHREKVTIKWLGFALVTCDTVFSILENFVSHTTLTRPRSFQDAIPALSYLFQMAISLIYASCVMYYSLSKRRFAFWHPKMKNICLVAMLSLASVLTPVVFFVLDVSQPNIATWGEYIQWVGAAAASVVVWEWVERIESLERDERKDGILGREIFDGDEMLDMNSDHKGSSSSNIFAFRRRSGSDENKKIPAISMSHLRSRVPFQRKKTTKHGDQTRGETNVENGNTMNGTITRPPQAATPISRSDTTSAASTVYAVRYQNVSSPSPAIPEGPAESRSPNRSPSVRVSGQALSNLEEDPTEIRDMTETAGADQQQDTSPAEVTRHKQMWQVVANPFKRKRTEPPAEVAAQIAVSSVRRSPAEHYHNLRDRMNVFGRNTTHKARSKGKQRQDPSPPLPVTVIPAKTRASRLEVPIDKSSSRQSVASQGKGSSTSSRSFREDLPVTVIPAPVRGGRTWSPDDMKDDKQKSQQRQESSSTGSRISPNITGTPPTNPIPEERNVSPGAASTFPESSIRRIENDSRNSTTSQRKVARLRTPTIDSLNNRLSSTSPNSTAARPDGSSGSGQTRSESAQRPNSADQNESNQMRSGYDSSSSRDKSASP